jgi:carbon monoxide dehydrogenase subunit G
MDMTGQQRIPASRDIIWKALNDPAVLQACIPGCQELVKSSDTQMRATALIKVGPVTAKFQGAVTLSDLDPPNGYRIAGEGQGGVAGFAKGSAIVRLEQDGDDTILHYEVSAQVGGKLSQLGGRLIDATAKQMSGLFFKRFAEEIEAKYSDDAPVHHSVSSTASANTSAVSPTQQNTPRQQAIRRPRPVSLPVDVTPGVFKHIRSIGIVLLLAAFGACWYLFGGALPNLRPDSGTHVSPDFTSGVLLVVVAAIGYLFGRQRTGSIHVDRDVIDQLAQAWTDRRE